MIITNIKIKNFKSFGNNSNEVSLSVDKGELILLSGKNGAGKCVSPNTIIEIDFKPENMPIEALNVFLDTMDLVRAEYVLGYIKEINPNHEIFERRKYK